MKEFSCEKGHQFDRQDAFEKYEDRYMYPECYPYLIQTYPNPEYIEKAKTIPLTATSPMPKDLEKSLIRKWEKEILS